MASPLPLPDPPTLFSKSPTFAEAFTDVRSQVRNIGYIQVYADAVASLGVQAAQASAKLHNDVLQLQNAWTGEAGTAVAEEIDKTLVLFDGLVGVIQRSNAVNKLNDLASAISRANTTMTNIYDAQPQNVQVMLYFHNNVSDALMAPLQKMLILLDHKFYEAYAAVAAVNEGMSSFYYG